MTTKYRESKVSLGFGDDGIDCIIWDENTWNGWAVPAFTKEQGMKVVEEYARLYGEAGFKFEACFDESLGNFKFGNEDIDDFYDSTPYVFEDDGVTYYAIGSANWTWTESE